MKRTLTMLAAGSAVVLFATQVWGCPFCGCWRKNKEAKEEKPKVSEECPSGVCALGGAHKHAEADHHNLSTFEMKSVVDSKSAVILDARSGQYDDGYRIPGAKSLNDKSTAEEVAAVIPSKDAAIVTYCSNTQCPASKRLADYLTKLGYTNVKEYPEGIAGWREAGGPVDKVK